MSGEGKLTWSLKSVERKKHGVRENEEVEAMKIEEELWRVFISNK